MFKKLLTVFLIVFIQIVATAQSVKIACIGNSVTFGAGLAHPGTESYPSVLQKLMGTGYEVKNFGLSGATLLKKGHRPYSKTKEFAEAMNFRPDIAIVHLGLNDTDPRNWPEYKDDFEPDYAWLLDTLKKQNPRVKLYICKLTPIFNGHPRFKSGTRDWYWQIQHIIPVIAKANHAEVIDLNEPLHNRPDLFADNLHPDQEGAAIIAQTVYENITGDYGGLKLPSVFTDHMVMQRNKPVPIYGTANANQNVEVIFNGKKLVTKSNGAGKWKLFFPAMAHGGPYSLTVKSENRIVGLRDILIGDVWLCAGQSNMAFPLSDASTGKSELNSLKTNPLLRLLNLKPIVETNNVAWDTVTLSRINQLKYFEGEWKHTDVTSASGFSAVAYFFGKKIVADEGVPVGLIEVAVGGSILESWIDRYTMEHDEQLVDVLTDWRKSDFIQEWARGRADVNLKNATKTKQRHPYEPAYNYEAGIARLTDFPIKGVIWYQGESNAQNVEQFEHSFPVLVNSWREKWGYNFPFYFVQLSAIDRPSWPYFRDAQRKLQLNVPNTGMAVSSDLGDSLDVHPKRKKEVGERLALLALKHSYNKKIRASGPVVLNAKIEANGILISFNEHHKLSTAGNGSLTGFELVTEKGNHLIPEKAIILNNQVLLSIPKGERIKKVLYAWRPFTRANLINEAGLPASTFSIPLK
ncbi:GDSL-type esterase/lipase family protein [Pedobacter nyackensis]|uniref:GDSL-type esterase/lipase family protein n=1 Tax=Pedobacter nyackensis TaxID=475255 RepID=UPI0029314E98|nr:GDSL-type esterase/lipase family protein [Pedobacter nyackensis]